MEASRQAQAAEERESRAAAARRELEKEAVSAANLRKIRAHRVNMLKAGGCHNIMPLPAGCCHALILDINSKLMQPVAGGVQAGVRAHQSGEYKVDRYLLELEAEGGGGGGGDEADDAAGMLHIPSLLFWSQTFIHTGARPNIR